MSNKIFHPSETIRVGIILAMVGGFMDTYSYVFRGQVFANAQTGNIILFGIGIYNKNYEHIIKYGLPIISFILGIFSANIISFIFSRYKFLHWKKGIILVEILLFSLIGLLSQDMNFHANNLTSLACGMQVETFRSIRNHQIATTMCIGNLRSSVSSLYKFIETRNKDFFNKFFISFILIIFFILGALLADYTIPIMLEKSILVCNGFLLIVFFII